MAYKHWSEKKIKHQIKELKSKYAHTKNELFLEDAESLKQLLNGDIDVFNMPFTFQDQLEDDARALELHFDFLDDIEKFALENAKKFQDFQLDGIFPIGNLSPSLILDFMKEFFYDYDEKFGKVFDELYKERFNNLMFSKGRSISYYVPSLEYSYINIFKDNTLDDFVNAVHEYTHAIVDRLYYREQGYTNYPFIELFSMFMEMIAADYMMDMFDDMEEDLNTIRLAGAKQLVVYAENISIEKNYIYQTHEIEDRKKVIAGMVNLSGKSRTYVKKLLDKTAIEKLSYTIPYITAIELYYLYKTDKDACKNLIEYLIYVDGLENYNVNLNDNGIILNTHSSEWIDTLIKRKKS